MQEPVVCHLGGFQLDCGPLHLQWAKDTVEKLAGLPWAELLRKHGLLHLWRIGPFYQLRQPFLRDKGLNRRRPQDLMNLRLWAKRENWRKDPATKKEITKPTHGKSGMVRNDYLTLSHNVGWSF
jgi:hypothetical protein